MKIEEIKNGVKIQGIQDFNVRHIFECGQCFRWKREDDGSYTGVAMGRVINVCSNLESSEVIIKNTSADEFSSIWFDYFDLGRDYSRIKDILSEDEVMQTAIQFGQGIRILHQSSWELLISFIVSANNSIPLISRSLNLLSQLYGTPIEYDGRIYYAFPTVEQLAGLDLEALSLCKAGFRCKYILDAVSKVFSEEIDLSAIAKLDIDMARKELMKVKGVGPKVADCIMLFSMGKHEAYPVDVWVKRVTEYYFLGKDVAMKEIQRFSKEKFGELAGFAQQYLFYYARETKLNI